MLAINNIITRNCWQAFNACVESEKAEGREFDRAKLIKLMTLYINAHEDHGYTRNRVKGHLDRVWPKSPKTPSGYWRIDYLKAFAAITEVQVDQLLYIDFPGNSHVSVAEWSDIIAQAIGDHISADNKKELVKNIREIPDFQAYAILMGRISNALIHSTDQNEAHARVSDTILKASYWDDLQNNTARKKPGKKSKAKRK